MQAKQHICDLSPYQPSVPLSLVTRKYGIAERGIVQLASNENPLGPSPKAKAAVRRAINGVHHYPDQYALTQALALHHAVDPGMIVLGNGSNDVLDLVARVFLSEGDEALSTRHSFAVYQIATRSTGADNVVIPAAQYGHDLAALQRAITAKTKVVWLDNPGNPTGAFVPYASIKQFLCEVPSHIIVVFDEAYREYLEPALRADATAWIAAHPNLILVRTFSKMHGLAGLRIGYSLAALEVAELLNRVRQPFNVNNLAMVAAMAALEDQEFVRKSYQINQTGREQLIHAFSRMGLSYIPPHGNFVTVRLPQAAVVCGELLRKGIVIRQLAGYGLPDYCRVTVGTASQNKRFLAALAEVLSAL